MRFTDPFREFDALFESFGAPFRSAGMMPMDAFRKGGELVIRFDLPGVQQEDISVSVENQVLTVTASRAFEDTSGADWLVRERPHGTHSRQIRLGQSLDASNITARYEHGVLFLTIPVKEEAKPRKIDVEFEAGSGAAVLETSGANAS